MNDELDWAMQQVETTVRKNQKGRTQFDGRGARGNK